MARKGVYITLRLYDKFNEKLPMKEEFYSVLIMNIYQMKTINMPKMFGIHSLLKI